MLTIDQGTCADLSRSRTKEWLLTNGLGGYASATICGMNTRRYHGLLVAATAPPSGRVVLLSKLEETLVIDGRRVDLSTNLYGEDVVHPEGYRSQTEFRLDPFPVSTFSVDGFTLEKSIFMVQGENTVVVEYALLSRGEGTEVSLEVRPLIAFRDFHSTTHENGAIDTAVLEKQGCIEMKPYPDLPSLFLAHDAGEIVPGGSWYRNFAYEIEKSRGLDHHEDLFNPLTFRVSLDQRTRFSLIASTAERSAADAARYRHAELDAYTARHVHHRARFDRADLIGALEQAAEQFIVARPPFQTIIAGYHWFGDWGRDTMIALPGLLLTTGRPEAAKAILMEFTRYVDGGMLPNRFPDHGQAPEYNTVDATLWFFDAIWQYLHYRPDAAWMAEAFKLIEKEFYPALTSIIDFHIAGTRYGIHADEDGFLWAGDDSTQLTWMDAKVGDTAFTPRSGRAVEIQALWYNALCIMEALGHKFGDEVGARRCSSLAAKLKANFERVFWNEQAGCLFDVVGETGDSAVRPNQAIAVSLEHCMLSKARAQSVVAVVERELLTPVGLRTLAPGDPKYRPVYAGDSWSRDSAYHQGTVWPWLAGPFFAAKVRFADDPHTALLGTQAWLDRFSDHMTEAGLGQVSEIFDGDYPHTPRGCMAQAWSVGELLRLARITSERLSSEIPNLS